MEIGVTLQSQSFDGQVQYFLCVRFLAALKAYQNVPSLLTSFADWFDDPKRLYVVLVFVRVGDGTILKTYATFITVVLYSGQYRAIHKPSDLLAEVRSYCAVMKSTITVRLVEPRIP